MDREAPVGVLGGTFDPVHHGHLRLAEEVADALALERVVLVPAALPNLRDRPRTEAGHRLRMVQLAAADNPRLAVDGRELRREGTSYTVDTLLELRAELGPRRPLVLILGADAFLRLPAWSRWLQLFDLAHVAVASRPGYPLDEGLDHAPELKAQWSRRRGEASACAQVPAGTIVRVSIPLLQISASDLRARMSRGASVRYLLPPAVVDYIAAHRLYASQ